jgi:hypothetical protein
VKIILGRALFALLALAAILEVTRHRYVMTAAGHICALWVICWLGARLTARSWAWLPVALLCFGIAWFAYPIVWIVILAVLDRASRPKPSDRVQRAS